LVKTKKPIELKCSGSNGYNFGTAGPIWRIFRSYEPERLGLSVGFT